MGRKAVTSVFVAKVTRTERMKSSVNGNPRFRVTFDNGASYPTQPDAGVAYGIENREYKEQAHRWTLNGRGHIIYVDKVES